MTFITSPCEVAQNASERASYVIFIKLFDIHHRSIILSAEPLAALPHFGSAKIATVASGRLSARAVVLPQAVLHNLLSLGNAQTSLALRSFNRRFRGRTGTIPPRRSGHRPAKENRDGFDVVL